MWTLRAAEIRLLAPEPTERDDMEQRDLYTDLVPWYPLLDPREDHEDECLEYIAVIRDALPDATTLLELGAGAGNNGTYLERAFTCTLSDLSPAMLAHSEAVNPECEHVVGDMRTQRLGRTFDAVLVHDAICHMTTRDDLRAALATVFAHTRPGGVALVIPDCLTESFCEWADDDHQQDDHGRSLQYTVRVWDPDPDDERTTSDYALLLRDATGVRAVHVRHEEGLFSRQTWLDELAALGFEPEAVPRTLSAEEQAGPYADEMFLCYRPA